MQTETVGHVTTTPEYWDCECEHNYIHSKSQKKCGVCGSAVEDQPDSRYNEVVNWLKSKKGESNMKDQTKKYELGLPARLEMRIEGFKKEENIYKGYCVMTAWVGKVSMGMKEFSIETTGFEANMDDIEDALTEQIKTDVTTYMDTVLGIDEGDLNGDDLNESKWFTPKEETIWNMVCEVLHLNEDGRKIILEMDKKV